MIFHMEDASNLRKTFVTQKEQKSIPNNPNVKKT